MSTHHQQSKMLARLNKISDEERDAMSTEDYKSFCQEYEELHYALWPSSTLCVPNRMSPQARKERNKQDEERRKRLFS
nr:hypothetical protein Cplu_163 [Cedratvirus plubellavi]